jgi:hypothetical protein
VRHARHTPAKWISDPFYVQGQSHHPLPTSLDENRASNVQIWSWLGSTRLSRLPLNGEGVGSRDKASKPDALYALPRFSVISSFVRSYSLVVRGDSCEMRRIGRKLGVQELNQVDGLRNKTVNVSVLNDLYRFIEFAMAGSSDAICAKKLLR